MKKKYFLKSFLILFSILIIFSVLLVPKPVNADSGILHFVNSLFPVVKQTEQTSLSTEDLAKLIQPSIVRIIRQTKGSVVLHNDFGLDLINLKILTKPLSKSIKIPVDDTVSGTGFMISSEGHIMSNAHVVSSQSSVNKVVGQLALYLIKNESAALTPHEKLVFDSNASTTEGTKIYQKFGSDIANAILKDVTLEATTTITVLNPNTKEDNLEGIIKDGFPASVVSVNDNYSQDQKDIAIIKINQENLPAISFASNVSTSSLVIGQKIFAFGFPANADINAKLGNDFVQPTFTSGTIGALKSSDSGDFQIIETDTKISSGSSGSPAVDDMGKVVGVMTYVTGDTGNSGDTFSFALPLQVVAPIIDGAHVIAGPGVLYQHFISGFSLFSQKHCANAIAEFELAKNTNPNFPVSPSFIDSYITQCKVMQASGLSVDTDWQQFVQNIKPYQTAIFISLFTIILVMVIGFFVILFSRKMRKDEDKMASFQITQIPKNIQPVDPFYKVPNIEAKQEIKQEIKPEQKPEEVTAEVVQPPVQSRVEMIVDFIKKQNSEKQNPGAIVLALRSQGYSDEEIQQAFNSINNPNL